MDRGALASLHIGSRGLLRVGGVITPDTGPLGGGRFPRFETDIARAKAAKRERLARIIEAVSEPTRETIEAAQALGALDLSEIEARIDEARANLFAEAQLLEGAERLRADALAREGFVSLDITPQEIVRDNRNLRLLLLMGG